MIKFPARLFFTALIFLLAACVPATAPAANLQLPQTIKPNADSSSGFNFADGTRGLTFPADFGAHPEYSTEWWYYTGNLQTDKGRHFGFELTIFRVGLIPPAVQLPADSQWYNHSLYFAHFTLSDIEENNFYAFERYSRPGPGLAGAEGKPYRVWLEDWNIEEISSDVYHLQAAQKGISLDLTLTDEMGVVLHGENGYSRKGEDVTNASYYYSQPRLQATGTIQVQDKNYDVSGLAWKDHEFSTSVLDENQIGWDWFSLQFEDGSALMIFQLRERDGTISAASSGTWIAADGTPYPLQKSDFDIAVVDEWQSPHTGGTYPSAWKIQLNDPACALQIRPWMADQEVNFPTFTYWEGAVKVEGACNGSPTRGNGYIELTGYAGNLPLP